jgi:hypothetical protein
LTASATPIGTNTLEVKSIEDYARGLRSAVRGFWSGQIDYISFVINMDLLITRRFTEAFMEGAGLEGIRPEELTPQELIELQNEINTERRFIFSFAQDIEENSKANGGKLQPLMNRIRLWANRYIGVRALGQSMARADPKLKWVLHSAETCPSCRKLDGKVKRASFWRAHDVRPKHKHKLECMLSAHGVPVCRCEFEITTDPLTRGTLPGLP